MSVEIRGVVRRLRRLPKELRKIESREINRQMQTSIGGTGAGKVLPVVGMTRRISVAFGISPQKRVRSRLRFPRSWRSSPRTLKASALMLFDTLPRAWFKAGVPAGGIERDAKKDKLGRVAFGGTFSAKLRGGKIGTMRKLQPQRSSRLPIGWAKYVDLDLAVQAIRADVLRKLAREWPRQIDTAFKRPLKNAFR